MPSLESGTERRHSYASPEAPRPQVSTFTPAFQVRVGDTPRAVPSSPNQLHASLCHVQRVGGKVDLLFLHTCVHTCAAMCLAGECHSPECPARLVSALLRPGVDRTRELCLVGSPVSLHWLQYCSALLETTSMSPLASALPRMSFSPLTLCPARASSLLPLPFAGGRRLRLHSQESAGAEPPSRAACGGAGTTRQEGKQGMEPGGSERPERLRALQLPGDCPCAGTGGLELARVRTASLRPRAQVRRMGAVCLAPKDWLWEVLEWGSPEPGGWWEAAGRICPGGTWESEMVVGRHFLMGSCESAMSHLCLRRGKQNKGVRADGCSFPGIC